MVKRSPTEEAFISCTCNGQTDKRKFLNEDVQAFFTGLANPNNMDHKHNSEIAGMMKDCSNCTTTMFSCSLPGHDSQACMLRQMKIEDDDLYLDLAKDVLAKRMRREPHEPGSCNNPNSMKTSFLSCTEYPSSIKCTQKCIFGYTLPEGITKEMHCSFAENVWKPSGFQECSPFIDCTVSLISAGAKSCQLGIPYTPPECNVTCKKYEDKPAVAMDRYVCDINGNWDKKLPHCVHSGSGFALVPAPRVKLHFPEEKNQHHETTKATKKQLSMRKAKRSSDYW